jgi:hypothetical protein
MTNNIYDFEMSEIEYDEIKGAEKEYFKELMEEYAARIGRITGSVGNEQLHRVLIKNLSVEYQPNENKFEQILDLRAYNNYKSNIMKIVKEMAKESFKNNSDTAYNLTVTNDFIEKNIGKFKKVLEREKDFKKKQDVIILKNFKKENKEVENKREILGNRIEKILTSKDKRVTRFYFDKDGNEKLNDFGESKLQRLKDKYNEMSFESLAAKRDIKFKENATRFQDSMNKAFFDTKDIVNNSIESTYLINLKQTNDLLNLNMTKKVINNQDIKQVIEAFQRGLHKLDTQTIARNRIEMFENNVGKSLLENMITSYIDKDYNKEKFLKIPEKLDAKIKLYVTEFLTNGVSEDFKKDKEYQEIIKNYVNEVIENGKQKWSKSNKPSIYFSFTNDFEINLKKEEEPTKRLEFIKEQLKHLETLPNAVEKDKIRENLNIRMEEVETLISKDRELALKDKSMEEFRKKIEELSKEKNLEAILELVKPNIKPDKELSKQEVLQNNMMSRIQEVKRTLEEATTTKERIELFNELKKEVASNKDKDYQDISKINYEIKAIDSFIRRMDKKVFIVNKEIEVEKTIENNDNKNELNLEDNEDNGIKDR